MIKLGLTGNRFVGKTEVCSIFKKLSIPVFDADILVKFLLHYNFEINHSIRVALGSGYFKSTDLNFEAIKRAGKFDDIVDIIETEVFLSFKKFQIKNANSIYVIFKSSILFEAGWNEKMDQVCTVTAQNSIRINRCKEATGLDYSEIMKLISVEMESPDKMKLSTHCIVNNGTHEKLVKSVNVIDMKIIDNYLAEEQKKGKIILM